MENVISITAGLFIAFSLFTETFGALMRSVGALNSTPATGYSSHVRIATVGRIFTLIGIPLIGLLVDTYKDPSVILNFGLYCFCISLVLHLIMKYRMKSFYVFALKIYFLINKSDKIKERLESYSFFGESCSIKGSARLRMFSAITICVQSIGFFLVNFVATIFPEKRAMIVQMAGWITFLGTLIHIFYVDPILVESCDRNKYVNEIIYLYVSGRTLGLLLNLTVVVSLFFIFSRS